MKIYPDIPGTPKCLDEAHGNPREAALLGYLAGIIDGEGTIRIQRIKSGKSFVASKRRNPWYYAQVSIGMTDIRPLVLLREFTGKGEIRNERVPSRKLIYRWVLGGRFDIIKFLNTLLPYLIVKRQQAEIVLDLLEHWEMPWNKKTGTSESEIQRREDAYSKVRKLNAVGAPATTERVDSREAKATV